MKVMKEPVQETSFAEPRHAYLAGMILDDNFTQIGETIFVGKPLILGFRIINKMKKAGSALKKHSRLMEQNYSDEEAQPSQRKH